MDQKEFCLKWNSYSDVFQGTFAALLRNEHFTDVTLSCDGHTIKCHKVVLSACSAYFETLLLDTSHPHPIIILRDVKFRDMQALVKFMYTGEVTVAQAQINSLIKVADLLKIKGLADPDESAQTVQPYNQPPERTLSTPPPTKRKRVETDSENNIYRDPLQDTMPSVNKSLNSLPLSAAPETSSSSNPQSEEMGVSPLHLKEEIGEVSLECGDDSSSQYEDQGDDFDYANDNLIVTDTGEKMEAGPSTSLNPSGLLLRNLKPKCTKSTQEEKGNPCKKIATVPGLWHPGAKITLTSKVENVGLFGDTFHCSLTVLSVTPHAACARTADIPSLLNNEQRFYSVIGILHFLKEEFGIYDVECYAAMIFKAMPKELSGNCIKAKNPFMNSCEDRFLTSVDMVKFLQHVCKITQMLTVNKKSKAVLLKVLSTLLYSSILYESGTCTLDFTLLD